MVLNKPVVFSTTFDTYTATEIIGEGGSARVYKAHDEAGQLHAVKLLDPVKATKDKVKRFKNEYLFCANNHHPNVVTMVAHGVFGEKDSPFIVMPLYDGSLRTLLRSGIAPGEVLRYFAHLMDGVECAHLQSVVHRDLKPENVLYDQESDQLLLSDFGIARFAENELFTAIETKDNDRLANFQYAAPEQKIRGADVDHRADIFSLGLILNEMFTGEVPNGTEYKTIEAVSPENLYLDDIVYRMIHQAPQDRPSDIEEVKRLLVAHKNDFISSQRISEISQTVVQVGEPDDALIADPIRLIDFDWANEHLTLILNQPVNEKWIQSLHHMGGHTSLLGSGPEQFSFREHRATINCREQDVQQIIDYFKDWLPRANTVYKERLEREARQGEEYERKKLQEELSAEEARQRVLRNVKI